MGRACDVTTSQPELRAVVADRLGRRDDVSATAIRRGAKGMAPACVELALERLANGGATTVEPVVAMARETAEVIPQQDKQKKVHAHA